MVESGRNHPSIYLWGLYNEPKVGSDFTANITVLNNRAHSLDSTRPTAMANISGFSGAVTVPDIVGLNYSTSINYTSNGINASTKPWVNTETRTNFYPNCYRGSTLDLDTTGVANTAGNAAQEWNQMNFTMATTGQLAGGHFWCFKDYNSGANTNGFEGVVDRYTVPKVMYYMFRKNWTGAAPDYPRPGTSTTIELKSDTNQLYATGADVFLITAAMRDAAGHQISSDNGTVAFTVSPAGSATFFGGNNVLAMGGRAGAYLRTTNYAGTITITATYPGRTSIPAATITVKTLANPAESYSDNPTAINGTSSLQLQADQFKLSYTASTKGIVFHCPPVEGRLSIVNSQGKTIFTRDVRKGESLLVNHRILGTGLLLGVWENGQKRIVTRMISAY
jgi:hypothetical protein